MVSLSACGKGSRTSNPENKDSTAQHTLRVMTYNIHHGVPVGHATDDIHLNEIADIINKQKPDLVSLQEVDVNTNRSGKDLNEAQKLGELTGMQVFFSKTLNYQGGAYGDAILSKFPILDKESIPLPMPDASGEARAVAIVTVKTATGTKMQFAATHLDILPNRMEQIKKLNSLSENSALPMIIGGDFNATPDSKEMKVFRQEFLLLCKGSCAFTAPSDNPTRTIDYIAINPEAAKVFHILSYNTINNTMDSDHLPVVAYLSKY